MNDNIYNLNLDYLILAHELIQSGRNQQAMVSLGLTPEAVTLLSTIPVNQLKILAQFCAPVPRQFLADLLA